MTKGKPWPADDEKSLRDWVASGIGLNVIVFSFEGKYTKNGVVQKMIDLDLKLKEEETEKKNIISSSFELPVELLQTKVYLFWTKKTNPDILF